MNFAQSIEGCRNHEMIFAVCLFSDLECFLGKGFGFIEFTKIYIDLGKKSKAGGNRGTIPPLKFFDYFKGPPEVGLSF